MREAKNKLTKVSPIIKVNEKALDDAKENTHDVSQSPSPLTKPGDNLMSQSPTIEDNELKENPKITITESALEHETNKNIHSEVISSVDSGTPEFTKTDLKASTETKPSNKHNVWYSKWRFSLIVCCFLILFNGMAVYFLTRIKETDFIISGF
ncbi:hypothetical protein CDIK_3762 [Cucumispora dikerogammari]|nr:hypothetical protein CDIK_3762 [Cucumispora dikerogammari]